MLPALAWPKRDFIHGLLGKGVRSIPRDALIADSSDPKLRGRAFGFHRSTDQIGAVAGPLLALPMLAAFHQSYRAPFIAAFVPAALGVALLFTVRETGSRREKSAAPPPGFKLRGADPRFRRLLLVMMLFAAGNSSDVFLILRAKQLGFSTAHIMALFAAYNLIYVLSAYPAGHISDRIGRKRVLVAGLVVFALVYLGFGLASAPAWIWALFMTYGLYQGLSDGNMRAFVVDLVAPEHRATALGLLSTTVGLLAFLASAVAGLLWQEIGPAAPFYYGAAAAALAAILLAGVERGRGNRATGEYRPPMNTELGSAPGQ